MAYLTQAALEVAVGGSAKLIQLTDDDGNGAPDAGVIAQIVAEVDSLVDSYLHKRYAVPLAAAPTTITALVARMGARAARRRKNMPLLDDVDNEKIDREWLEGVAKGLISLGVQPLPTASSLVVDKVGEREDSPRNVTRRKLEGLS